MTHVTKTAGTQLARWVLEERAGQSESETYTIMSQIGGIQSAHQGLLMPPHSLQAQIILHALAEVAPDQRQKVQERWAIAIADAMPEQGYQPAVWRGKTLFKVVECWNAVSFMHFRDLVLIAMFDALTRLSALGEVITAQEAAERYGLTASAIRKACAEGRVQARKVGGSGATWLISRQSADEVWDE